jgi:hypothetical protein
MAHGLSAYLCNAWLDSVGNNTSFAVAVAYVKLHTQDPGPLGTAFPATETTRKAISFGVASAGVITSDADISWTNIAGSQDATHFTVWDNLTAGNFLFSGNVVAGAYTAGDTYTITAGNLSASLTVAS